MCSAVLTEQVTFGIIKPQKYPKQCPCKAWSPRQPIYCMLGRKLREAPGTPGAVKGSGDGAAVPLSTLSVLPRLKVFLMKCPM